MSSCPAPQKLSQIKSNAPDFSGFSLMTVTWPGGRSARTLSSGTLKPCTKSSDVISSRTSSPFLKMISLGVKENRCAITLMILSFVGLLLVPKAVFMLMNAATARQRVLMIHPVLCRAFMIYPLLTGNSVILYSAVLTSASTSRKPNPL